MPNKLLSLLNCPICDTPMMHTRLHGYQCHNPEHNRRLPTDFDIRQKPRPYGNDDWIKREPLPFDDMDTE